MDEIRLARSAALAGMIFLGVLVGFPHQLQIVGGAVGPHSAQQLAELGHREGGGRDLFAQGRHNGLYRGKRRSKQRLHGHWGADRVDFMPAKILISGSSGLLGSALIESLGADGYEITRLTRKPTS